MHTARKPSYCGEGCHRNKGAYFSQYSLLYFRTDAVLIMTSSDWRVKELSEVSGPGLSGCPILRLYIQFVNDAATLAEFKDKLTAEASYRSEHNSMKSHFFHGTRTSILDKLEAWAKGMDSQCPFYVLSGVAGAGKSTIAYEFARRLEQDKLLGATFFFVRGDEKLSTTSFLIPTLAYQLSQYQPDLLCRIVKGARKHLDLGQRQSFEWQIDELIIDPLKDVPFNHSPMIIIIDAVDECTTSAQDDVARLLYLLLDRIRGLSCPLRILITTRPELHIENALNSCEFQDVIKPFKLHDIPRSTVDSDIYLYLEDGLKSFRYNKELVAECPRAITDLTARAESLFIYASTALNFLVTGADGPAFAARRLNILLSNASGSTTFRSHLDDLYLTVLENAFPKNILDDEDTNYESWLRDILGVISLAQDHISLKTLESLLGVAVSDTLRILRRLGSLIIVSAEDSDVQMRPLHASFPQFLIDKERCTAPMFFIDPSLYHGRLALRCLQALTEPSNLAGACRETLPAPHLLYSCVHWPTHLASTNKPSQELLSLLDSFMEDYLLKWFEFLSYIGRIEIAAPALLQLYTWYQVSLSRYNGYV